MPQNPFDNQLFVQSLQMISQAINQQTQLEMQRTQLIGQAMEQKRTMDLREQNLKLAQEGLVLKQQIEQRRAKEQAAKANPVVNFDALLSSKDFAGAEKVRAEHQAGVESSATLHMRPEDLTAEAAAINVSTKGLDSTVLEPGATLEELRKRRSNVNDQKTQLLSNVQKVFGGRFTPEVQKELDGLVARDNALMLQTRLVGKAVSTDPTLRLMQDKLNTAQGRAAGLQTPIPQGTTNAGGVFGPPPADQVVDKLDSGNVVNGLDSYAQAISQTKEGTPEYKTAVQNFRNVMRADLATKIPPGDAPRRASYKAQAASLLKKYNSPEIALKVASGTE